MLLHYKAQLYCICILLIMLSMCVGGIKKRNRENRLFNRLLIFALINMFFDIGSNYTVNHLELVSGTVNRIVHICFFISMATLFLIVYKYLEFIIDKELDKALAYKNLTYIPYGILCVLILILPIYYKEESTGNWSYGPGPNAVYGCVAIYVVLIVRLIIKYRSKISKKNKTAIIMALSCELVAALFQMLMPAALTSSLGVILLCLCIYTTLANPDAALVKMLKEQTERADAANRAKSDFLAKMSHEIRTPINAVLGMNEMILRESTEHEIKKYAADIKGSANNLMGIINEILDSSKIESGKMELSETRYDMASMLYDLQNMFDIKAKEKDLELRFEVDRFIPLEYYGDDLRIKQILMNLLSNAIKYTPAGRVTVKITGKREGDNEILSFSIKDTGIGIKEEDIEKLFAKYIRIEERQNRYIEGTGLGINIVIQLLKLMDSELKVNSIYGMGTEFYFDIVQKIENDEILGDFRSKVANVNDELYVGEYTAPDAKVLVVDDNDMNLKVFRNFIKHTKIQLTEAHSGMECIKLVKENKYNAIFLDHMMPELDGVETFKIIKEQNLCEGTPIIVLTANATKGARRQYLSRGFNDFLSKPILPEKFDNILLRHIPKELIVLTEPGDGVSKEKINGKAKGNNKEDDSEEKIELPEIEEFDFDYALRILNSEKLVMDTLKDFYGVLKELPDKLDALYQDISTEEGMKNYRIEVHALKSVAATVGALLLSKFARILEIAASNGEESKITSLHSILIEEIEKHIERLGEVFSKESTELKEFDLGTVSMYLQMLKASLSNKDYKVADYLIVELCAYKYSEELDEHILRLKEYVTQLMSEEALETITIMQKILAL